MILRVTSFYICIVFDSSKIGNLMIPVGKRHLNLLSLRTIKAFIFRFFQIAASFRTKKFHSIMAVAACTLARASNMKLFSNLTFQGFPWVFMRQLNPIENAFVTEWT